MQARAVNRTLKSESLIGLAFSCVGALYAWGALDIQGEAGYGGVGPNFLPWVVAVALSVCGIGLLWQTQCGGFVNREVPEGAANADWCALAWVSVGILANAALIQRMGFVLSCTLCFVLAVRGFHAGQGRLDVSLKAWLGDVLIGFALSAPVFWLFGKVLGIQLPALHASGWI